MARFSSSVALVVALAAVQPAAQFRATADLVVLNVRVTDRDGRHVPGLTRDAFTVFEDGRPQPVSLFADEDAPVTVGLIVDASVSMWAIKDQLIAGATAFASASHPGNELFAVAFNDERWPALPPAYPFTSDPDVLRRALTAVVQPRGRTALFDAIGAGLDYTMRGTHPRKALVVLSDGGDNASRASFNDVVRQTLVSNAVIYGVAVVDPVDRGARPEVLRRLARATGGEAFAPRTRGDVGEALGRIASDIRRSYTLGYVPAGGRPGERHTLRVAATSRAHRGLVVRTREAYREAPLSPEGSHVAP
jgi:Ca-activated chloride channel family protein